MRIPNHVIRNNTVRLECHFDMNGEALYSVKWYKDGYEFYRYVPRDHPPAQVFMQNGIYVNVSLFSISIYFSNITKSNKSNILISAASQFIR